MMTIVLGGCGGDTNDGAAACDDLKTVVSQCYDGFCKGAGAMTAFCKCWSAGQDISVQTCACIPQDLDTVCKAVDPKTVDPSKYACSAASDAVSHICN